MRSLRCGLGFWGLCAGFQTHRNIFIDTPDGHRYGRPILVDALNARGHSVYALHQRRDPEPYPGLSYVLERNDGRSSFPDLDVVFLEHRWSTYKNDVNDPRHSMLAHEPDLDRQHEIIEFYRDRCPIIVWDTDLKVTREFEARYPELIIADPSFMPRQITRKRHSLQFWTDFRELLPVSSPYPIYGYVGNNYERQDEFERYYFNPAAGLRKLCIQTSMYGNWLQHSPDRQNPSKTVFENPFVSFNDRRNFFESMSIMNRFVCTTHVSKPDYYQSGFISPRHLEALAVNCPALVPSSQVYNGILGREWIVSDGDDVRELVSEISQMTIDQRKQVVSNQRETLKKTGMFDVSRVIEFIKSVV